MFLWQNVNDLAGSETMRLASVHGQQYHCVLPSKQTAEVPESPDDEKQETGIPELLNPMQDGPCLILVWMHCANYYMDKLLELYFDTLYVLFTFVSRSIDKGLVDVWILLQAIYQAISYGRYHCYLSQINSSKSSISLCIWIISSLVIWHVLLIVDGRIAGDVMFLGYYETDFDWQASPEKVVQWFWWNNAWFERSNYEHQ